MKALINKFFIFHFLVTILLSCSSVPKEYIINDDICHYSNPIFKITKEEITFDIKKYEKQLGKGDLVLVNNEKFKNRFHIYSSGTIGNIQTNKDLVISKNLGYYSNGKIQYSNFEYINGYTKIGKETDYDLQGSITKVLDYEKGYKICWAEAIEIVKEIAKKDIRKYEIKEFYLSRNDLNEFPDVKPLWEVGLMNGNEKFFKQKVKKGNIRYVIDGITGKLIKTYRIRISH